MRIPIGAVLAAACLSGAAAAAPSPEAGHAEAGWKMFDRRIGMFVHWGVYSVGGWHEQEWMRRGMEKSDYEKYVGRFDARRFDPDRWIDVAQSLGAEYIVFTSKHHDGFCMWATETTDFNVMNSPCGRDVLKELSDACRRRGMRLGLYYSNPDWHHPNAWNPKSSHQLAKPNPGDEPDMEKYRAHVRAQVAELLTRYGEICCFFWDIPPKIDDPGMNALVRRLQPGIMVNNRGWSGDGDYSTPERHFADGGVGAKRFAEACDSVGAQSWGYRANEDYRTVGYLTRAIDRRLSVGANFLLNVGPKRDGTIPEEGASRLASAGRWFAMVRESYRGVETVTNLVSDARCRVTRRGRFVYLHYPDGLDATGVDLYPLDTLPREAVLLNTGARLGAEVVPMPWRAGKPSWKPSLHVFGVPADAIAGEAAVIRLEFGEAASPTP